jgi:hypothetical protein
VDQLTTQPGVWGDSGEMWTRASLYGCNLFACFICTAILVRLQIVCSCCKGRDECEANSVDDDAIPTTMSGENMIK